jgi:DnaJ like chaperone protein
VNQYLKWMIAGGLGWAFAGPVGLILGVALGNIIETYSNSNKENESDSPKRKLKEYSQPGDFEISLLILSAVVIKADGISKREELDYVRRYFAKMYGARRANESFALFKEIINQPISIHSVCSQIRGHMSHAGRLQLIYFLFGLAKSDGIVSNDEVNIIQKIANYLYINDKDFLSIRSMYYVKSAHHYEVLEINPEVNDDEVKRAYRRVVLKFHPDKVEGLGEEVRKGAQEKFLQIQLAYEEIKKERGL